MHAWHEPRSSGEGVEDAKTRKEEGEVEMERGCMVVGGHYLLSAKCFFKNGFEGRQSSRRKISTFHFFHWVFSKLFKSGSKCFKRTK